MTTTASPSLDDVTAVAVVQLVFASSDTPSSQELAHVIAHACEQAELGHELATDGWSQQVVDTAVSVVQACRDLYFRDGKTVTNPSVTEYMKSKGLARGNKDVFAALIRAAQHHIHSSIRKQAAPLVVGEVQRPEAPSANTDPLTPGGAGPINQRWDGTRGGGDMDQSTAKVDDRPRSLMAVTDHQAIMDMVQLRFDKQVTTLQTAFELSLTRALENERSSRSQALAEHAAAHERETTSLRQEIGRTRRQKIYWAVGSGVVASLLVFLYLGRSHDRELNEERTRLEQEAAKKFQQRLDDELGRLEKRFDQETQRHQDDLDRVIKAFSATTSPTK